MSLLYQNSTRFCIIQSVSVTKKPDEYTKTITDDNVDEDDARKSVSQRE